MNRFFHTVMETVYWVMIFLSPVLISALIGLIVTIIFDKRIEVLYALLIMGGITGTIVAERIRRKYGCANFWSRILATPDIWPLDETKKKA